MKIINLEQGSQEWIAWRNSVITSTDASIIMGSNPWETPFKCWQRKLGLVEEKQTNEAMERGKRLEPEARAHFKDKYLMPMMNPLVVESTEFDFLGASLDGFSEKENSILEIKCGSAKLHSMAAFGEIPEYYKDQMQHQLLVTGADRCFYYSYSGEEGICIEVLPDEKYEEKFLPKAREFLKCLVLFEPPPLQEKDYINMEENPLWKEQAELYKNICQDIKNLENRKEVYRKELIRLSGNNSCTGHGLKVIKTMMRGRVNYDEIEEIKNLNLDKYRKPSTILWKILVS